MKKFSERLQALIADSEIPLSDAWGKLIDDLKAAESQPPVAVIEQADLDRLESGSDADVWTPSREEIGDILLYAVPQAVPDSADREMLKRLAVIMSGSDSGGEIAALTVTAQSLVDRCKTLAKERDASMPLPDGYVTAEHRRVIGMLLNVCAAAFELADDSCQQDVDGEPCHVVDDQAFSRLSDALDSIENTLPDEYADLPNTVLQWAAIPRHALRKIL